MADDSKVIETKYVMTPGLDFTDARVRVDGNDVWIRVGGLKSEENDHAFLIEEAELQARGPTPINGKARPGA
jgi:hypothetical protein